jgi:hypothetical protein
MAWQAVRRATLLIPSGPAHDPLRKHLHIVLNDPYPDNTQTPKVLVVSVTSIPASNIYDTSCTLFPGEHPFVSEHSYVAYKFASLQDPASLQAKVNANQFVAKPILSEKAFGYVVAGLQDSPYTEPYLLKFFADATRPL